MYYIYTYMYFCVDYILLFDTKTKISIYLSVYVCVRYSITNTSTCITCISIMMWLF